MNTDFYQLKVKTPSGQEISMTEFKGKVILIVNTATKCGLAPQFEGLEKLHQEYQDKGLVVLGFPCNQFLSQEPETNDTMVESCQVNFGVTFQLLEKCDVNGPDTHPVFKYLKKKLGGWFGSKIKWNFTKFLVDRNGYPVKRYAPTVKPEAIEGEIVKQLNG
ncbi:glutathione peroxidase [Crocinitomicaceae bacterium CZZ-1]|uniref:Glutathione peroxidase n=1 Tax=Taishania pollutisoli TaxID=2766479 RepID=A0A8J6P624_9FLAO|nr:glutathione peroxidase [Taishania pollutisoli]MBC9812544.1 glutathione peroxidase [Taishania pollutisoli]MBX2949441.1 glutathione peroxidase [Crocinitomicaceae bacterium]NGF74520.1 glutathione peroxidase [Fluviicola sp. SGL-29]